MVKLLKPALVIFTFFLSFNCSSDDDCPDVIEVNINDPESIKRAEACGLAPAGPIGRIWVSESYRLKHNL